MSLVCCGIVTYNPEIMRLRENISAINSQVEKIFIYDNGSNNASEIAQLCTDTNCKFINSGSNSGMAVALNYLANTALENCFDFILFLDQDSVAMPSMVGSLLHFVAKDVGIVCPAIVDRNTPKKIDEHPPLASVNHTITSGSLVNLEAYSIVGGYDERLFVDWVDLDFCHNLRLHGYKILRTKSGTLLHELGNKEYVMSIPRKGIDGKWRLRRYYRSNHAMFRQEDKARSQTIVIEKYKHTPIIKEVLIPIISLNFFDLLLEKHRFQLLKAKLKGRKKALELLNADINS